MEKKNKRIFLLTIISLVIIAISGSAYYFMVYSPKNSKNIASTEKQLYTCAMHLQYVSDKPGNCPFCGMKLVPKTNSDSKSQNGQRKILYWRAPMNPKEIYDKPGKSAMGMDLVPVYEDEASGEGTVKIDPSVEQNMNLKITEVKRMKMSSRLTTNGIMNLDDRRHYIVTTRVNGWIEKLYINYNGMKVRKGDKLMEIYSPELVAAQQELLTAMNYNSKFGNSAYTDIKSSGNEILNNAEKKLKLYNISDEEIKKIEQTQNIKTNLTLYAQNSGTVINKYALEGQKVSAGMPLMEIADLSNLWLEADIYENELQKVHLGDRVNIKFNFMPQKMFNGIVSFIYPTIDPKARTAKIRIDVPNYSDVLKPSMYASVEIQGRNLGEYPAIPENSVIRTGVKDVVILSLGEGRFKPQPVKLGILSDGYYQVIEGLQEGMKIVSSAQFMIDSESNLKAALNAFQTNDAADTVNNKPMTPNEQKDDMKQMNMNK